MGRPPTPLGAVHFGASWVGDFRGKPWYASGDRPRQAKIEGIGSNFKGGSCGAKSLNFGGNVKNRAPAPWLAMEITNPKSTGYKTPSHNGGEI